MCSCWVCVWGERKAQIRKSVPRLCCIRPGSPGQLGYHVMEKIAIFSSGSLTYLSPLTDTPPPSTPTYPATSLPFPPTLCLPFVPHFLPTFTAYSFLSSGSLSSFFFHPLSISIPPPILGPSIQFDLMCVLWFMWTPLMYCGVFSAWSPDVDQLSYLHDNFVFCTVYKHNDKIALIYYNLTILWC